MGRYAALDVTKIKAVAVRSLLNRFGEDLEAVVLFGSCARGRLLS